MDKQRCVASSRRLVSMCRVSSPRPAHTGGARGSPPGHTGYTGVDSSHDTISCHPTRLPSSHFALGACVSIPGIRGNRAGGGARWVSRLFVFFCAGAVLSLPVTPRVRFTTQNAPHAHRRLQTRRPLQHTPTHDTYARAALPSRSQSHRRAPKFFLVLFRDFISASGTGCSSKRLVRGL